MSYPTNRNPRDRQHSHFEEDDQERGVEQRGRSYMSERDQEFRQRRPGERESRESERFGDRRYFDPYSGRNLGGDEDDRRRDYSRQQQGYAPYPYGEEPGHRHLEDWQRPWQMGEEAAYGSRSQSPSQQRSYASGGYQSNYASSRSYARGAHRGRGPKGYQRSDERLREDICERLTEDPHIDASELTIEVANGEVTISGTVPDRRMKRAAEDLVEECSGVKQVHNALRVDGARGRMNDDDDRFGASMRPETRH